MQQVLLVRERAIRLSMTIIGMLMAFILVDGHV